MLFGIVQMNIDNSYALLYSVKEYTTNKRSSLDTSNKPVWGLTLESFYWCLPRFLGSFVCLAGSSSVPSVFLPTARLVCHLRLLLLSLVRSVLTCPAPPLPDPLPPVPRRPRQLEPRPFASAFLLLSIVTTRVLVAAKVNIKGSYFSRYSYLGNSKCALFYTK